LLEKERRMEKASVYTIKSEVFPTAFLMVLGTIDCVTTVIGVLYSGAVELNPFMTRIVSTNIAAFMVVKLFATFLIGVTYMTAKIVLNKTQNKETRTFRYSKNIMKLAYSGLVVFFIMIVGNNFTVLLT
jgi:hypothetical protein